MSERSIPFLLSDIKESIENILHFTSGLSLEMYQGDIKTIHAFQHNFMIIGEAVARIPEEYKKINEHINWRQIKDFRNVIVHDYFGIDNTIVWDIIHESLPELLDNINSILSDEKE